MRLYLLSLLCLWQFSCGTQPTRETATDNSYDTLYSNIYANRFAILERGDTIVLRVNNPWQGAENVVVDYPIISPLKRVVCMSSSYVAFLDALNLNEAIVGVSGLNFITNQKIRKNGVKDVGYDNNVDYETIVGMKPDAVLVYEVAGENSAVSAKLKQLGIPVIYIADYLEDSPLARAEWIMVFGALTNRIDQARALFEQISEQYNTLKGTMDTAVVKRPSVMLNSPYRDVWYVPGDRNYMVQMIRDAGGDYVAKGVDNDISRPIAAEVAYKMMLNADVWLHPTTGVNTMEQLRESNHRFTALNVVRKGEVYSNNARSTPAGGSDFWESAIVRPDVVLADLIRIFHPDLLPDHELYYYFKLK